VQLFAATGNKIMASFAFFYANNLTQSLVELTHISGIYVVHRAHGFLDLYYRIAQVRYSYVDRNVLTVFSFLWCPIVCLYVLNSVLWCPLRLPHKTMFSDVYFLQTIVNIQTYCVVFLFSISSCYVPYVTSFSGLSIFDYYFVIL
jgi:hypothetical protein